MYQQVPQQQVMMQQQPMMVQQQPMMVQQQPMMVQQQPMMVQQQPMMVQQQPMMVQQQPIMVQQQPIMVQQPQVMMVQQPIGFVQRAANVIYVGDFLTTLNSLESVLIQRVFEYRDFFACKDPNAYLIFPGDQDGNQKGSMPYLRSKETSTCFCYLCIHPLLREYQLDVTKFSGMYVNKKNRNVQFGDSILQMKHKFQCPPFYCFCRPEMQVFHTENGKQDYLGLIKIPFKICNLNLNCEVYDANLQLKYLIVANCCQLSLHLRLPCDSCNKVDFVIQDAAGNVLNEIEKLGAGFCANLCNISDIFKVKFPSISTKEDKALLIAAAQFMDHMFFQSENEKASFGEVDI